MTAARRRRFRAPASHPAPTVGIRGFPGLVTWLSGAARNGFLESQHRIPVYRTHAPRAVARFQASRVSSSAAARRRPTLAGAPRHRPPISGRRGPDRPGSLEPPLGFFPFFFFPSPELVSWIQPHGGMEEGKWREGQRQRKIGRGSRASVVACPASSASAIFPVVTAAAIRRLDRPLIGSLTLLRRATTAVQSPSDVPSVGRRAFSSVYQNPDEHPADATCAPPHFSSSHLSRVDGP